MEYSYINTSTGVSKGPIKILKNGIWLNSVDKTFKVNETEVKTITCLEFFKTIEDKYRNDDAYLQVPNMDTGFHMESFEYEGEIREISVPNAGDLTVPNIAWVRAYCSNLVDNEGVRIDISDFPTFLDVDKILNNYDESVVQPIAEKLDETREICDNLSRWKSEENWILDGGSPSHTLRF